MDVTVVVVFAQVKTMTKISQLSSLAKHARLEKRKMMTISSSI